MLRILVTGATGYIGGRLVPRLLERGHRVRCLARNPQNLAGRNWNDAEIVTGDILNSKSLDSALNGIDVAYYLVHSMRAGEAGFEERDRAGAKNFAEAAKKAGVQRILYLGGLGGENSQLSPHLNSRHEVGDLLRSSGIPVTEFRAAVIVGSGSISFEMIRYLTERLPVMVCPRWVKSLCQPIAIRDVLAYLVESLEKPETAGKIFDIGGPDILSYREMMLGYAAVRGLKRWLIQVPVLTPRLSSYWVDLITPIPASISRPLIEGLKYDVICQNKNASDFFSVRPMGYREAVRLALERIHQGQIETIWSGSHASLKSGSPPPSQLENREGLIREVREAEIASHAERVFSVISGIGGNRGWFYAEWAWRLRGFLDRIVGGPGMRRGRRNPDQLAVGDALDFWRVESVIPNRLLRLRAEMKVPGRAWLQMEVSSLPENSQRTLFVQTALFEPKGLAGLLYWYALYPIHRLIFSGLVREIKRRCEARQ